MENTYGNKQPFTERIPSSNRTSVKAQDVDKTEMNLVFDSIIEAPEQFKELYDDFISGTLISKVSEADMMLRELVMTSNIDKEKYDLIREKLIGKDGH
mgnify:CR=1 FL=1